MTLDQLFEIAAARGIEIDDVPMRSLRAASFPEGWIAIDRRKYRSEAEFKCDLAHEIGHCETGSFYNIHSLTSAKELSERHANRFAAELLVPLAELRRTVTRGISFNRILADMFDVTVEFINMVMEMFEAELCAAMRCCAAAKYSRVTRILDHIAPGRDAAGHDQTISYRRLLYA